MPDILPYCGFAPDVLAALNKLEKATEFDSAAYRALTQERDRRIPIFLMLVLPCAALGAGIVWILQANAWLPRDAPWAYAFGPILFVAAVMTFLRPQAARDDARLGEALKKWRAARL